MAWQGSSDTIFALATGAGRGGVAIIRISGRLAGPILDRLTGPRPQARRATLRHIVGGDGENLDRGLVLWFPAPGSYTGEDCAELHLHAGPAVIEAVGDALAQAGARPAEAGEFTQRAFLSGRMDLLEAEGVADLIDAATQAQRRQALAQSQGALSGVYRDWADQLRRLVAAHEACLDFPDEASAVPSGGEESIARLERALRKHLTDGRGGETLRNGLLVAVIGPPNVGKSSLVNVLTGRDVAIVSRRPGTTRDVLEARYGLEGLPLTLLDTAGLRESDDEIEREGIRRARERARQADIVLHVTEAGDRPEDAVEAVSLWISNKCDIVAVPTGAIGVSAVTGEGIEALKSALADQARRLCAAGGSPIMTRSRHRDCLSAAADHLRDAGAVSDGELRAEELRLALGQLGRLTGAVDVEDILGDIFSSFCIGK